MPLAPLFRLEPRRRHAVGSGRDEEDWVRRPAALMILAGLAGLAGCAPRPAPQAAPPPAPLIASAPQPPVPPPAPDWRDVPLSSGDWSYAAAPEGSRALFGGGVFTLRCDPARGQIELARIAAGAGTITV